MPCTPKTAFVPQVWAPFLPVQNFSLSQAFNLTLFTALWRRKLSWWAWAPPNHLTVSNTHQMLFCTHTHTRSEKTTHQGAEEQAAVPTKSSANPCAVVPTGKHAPPAVCGVVCQQPEKLHPKRRRIPALSTGDLQHRLGAVCAACYPVVNAFFILKCLQVQSKIMPILSLALRFIKLVPTCTGLSLWGSCFSEVIFSCIIYFLLQWLDCRAEMRARIVFWICYQILSFLRPRKRN